MIGVAGALGSFIPCDNWLERHPELLVNEMLYEPDPRFGIVTGKLTLF